MAKKKDKKKVKSNKGNDSFFDWVGDNATPIIVGAVAATATIMTYNYLTSDDDDMDTDSGLMSNISDLLR